MSKLYRQLLNPLGLTYPQYLVMLSLWDKNPQAVGQLGEAVALDSNTLTPLLKRMEQAGLVERRRSEDDERVTIINLTSAGRAMQARAEHIPACVLQATGLTGQAAETLRDEIMQMRNRIDASVTKP
jgi:DNA-binding MarR family transcriptional regulator